MVSKGPENHGRIEDGVCDFSPRLQGIRASHHPDTGRTAVKIVGNFKNFRESACRVPVLYQGPRWRLCRSVMMEITAQALGSWVNSAIFRSTVADPFGRELHVCGAYRLQSRALPDNPRRREAELQLILSSRVELSGCVSRAGEK